MILDGFWTCMDGVFSDGGTDVEADYLRDAFPSDPSSYYDPATWYQQQLDRTVNFHTEKESFLLAPLDHITQENSLSILSLLEGMYESRMYSADALKEAQHIWPEQLTHDGFVKALSKSNHTQFVYFFLESANPDEMSEEADARTRAEEALTVSEAVLAATELDFRLSQRLTFPYSAYMLLTGQMDEPGFIPDESELDYNTDERLSYSDQRILTDAALGDPDAQNMLAELYLSGKYPDEDGKRAVHWIRLAAEQGIASAQSNYGVALQRGLGGIEINNEEAVEWFRKAADQDFADAQLNLGLAYSAGRGVERDIPVATIWFRKAAESGSEMAKLILENGLIING
jgi:TPR repeat protein